jgi:hypothetical protein
MEESMRLFVRYLNSLLLGIILGMIFVAISHAASESTMRASKEFLGWSGNCVDTLRTVAAAHHHQ